MPKDKRYEACQMSGEGEILVNEKKARLDVIDITSNRIRIVTKIDLEIGEEVVLGLWFNSYIFHADMDVDGKICDKIHNGDEYIYEIEFINMKENHKIEINELLKQNCIHYPINMLNECEEGTCVFYRAQRVKS